MNKKKNKSNKIIKFKINNQLNLKKSNNNLKKRKVKKIYHSTQILNMLMMIK